MSYPADYEQITASDIRKGDLVFLAGKVRKVIQDPGPTNLIHIVTEGDGAGSAIPFKLEPTWSVNRHFEKVEVPVFLTPKLVEDFRAGRTDARMAVIAQVREALDSTLPAPVLRVGAIVRRTLDGCEGQKGTIPDRFGKGLVGTVLTVGDRRFTVVGLPGDDTLVHWKPGSFEVVG